MSVKGIIVVMGVSGSGKTTIGKSIAEALQCPFVEGDALHSEHARRKMADGTPLDDDDRWPWLTRVAQAASAAAGKTGQCVTACSALRLSYRDHIRRQASQPVFFLHLTGTPDQMRQRLGSRQGHFMPASLIDSQFATLEPLLPTEAGAQCSAVPNVPTVVANALKLLRA